MPGFGARQARRPWQRECIGDAVEVVGHLEAGIIDHVIDAVTAATPQSGDAGRRQVIGMDVVGEHIVTVDQRRQAFLQALQRQAIGRVNAGRAQDGNSDTGRPPPGPQAALGGDAAGAPCALGIQAAGLVDRRAAAIAVNACRTNINQAPW